MQAPPQDLALFGKLPAHGDFVRHNATGASVRAMDEWVRRGLYFAKSQARDALDGAYPQAPTSRFYFDPGTRDGALLGALHPSRDRVGRHFPFMAAIEIDPGGVEAVPLLPVQYASFLHQTATVVREAAAGEASMQEVIQRVRPVRTDAPATVQDRYDRFLRQTLLHELWERLWGYADDSRTYLLFKNLLDIVEPLQDGVPSRFPLVLRFPLSDDPEEQPFEAAFWMQLCLRLMGEPAAQPSFFWSEAAEGGTLLLTLRPPPVDLFLHLVDEEAETENVCRLEQMGTMTAVEAALAIPRRYGERLESRSLTLHDMLHSV